MAIKHQNIVEVNQANFQAEVVQRSHQVPVLVDFWAPWCGPCRMLGPVLERLAAEPNSQFVLAKVNSDLNPQLSMQFGVRGIPAVKAFANGRVVDEFVGAQPEPRVRQFVQGVAGRFRPDGGFRPEGQSAAQPRAKASAQPPSSDPAARLQQAKRLLRQGKGCEAQAHLRNFPAGDQSGAAGRLRPLAEFLCQMSQGQIQGGPADLSLLYRQVADAVGRREYAAALYNLLAILRQDGGYQDGQARAVMEGIFELLGAGDPLTQAYQSQAAALLGA
jgi:putative thioredoxin